MLSCRERTWEGRNSGLQGEKNEKAPSLPLMAGEKATKGKREKTASE